MRAEDLELLELIDIADGNISMHGRRLVLHSMHAFSRFRKDIIDMLGWDHARRLFTRFGFFCGQADAAALQRVFRWETTEEWLRAGLRLHSLEGVVRASISEFHLDEEKHQFYMKCAWHDSVEAEEHLMEVGPGDQTICWKLIGYASGYASYCLGRSIYFIETSCQGKRDRYCQSVGKDLESWGDEIKPHLPFFESEDIKGEVEKLTSELRHKNRALSRHQKELASLKHKSVPYFVEGRSKSMQNLLDLASRVARFGTSVLITGETGVGKEILARYIHGASNRSSGPFMAVNCGALPETLLESELFGHKAGSFTGAIRDRVGMLEDAAGGTVFLDEIGDISQAVQLKILRVLQEKEILRLGENRPRKIDVRIIAATNRNLDKAVADENFREDLLYRLRVIEIEMPPLRNRREDILPLARFLVDKIASRLEISTLRLDATTADPLLAYLWPGNVRELENALERAAVVSPDGLILPSHLPSHISNPLPAAGTVVGAGSSLKEIEAAHIRNVVESTGGNKTRAAKILGISQATLWRKLKQP